MRPITVRVACVQLAARPVEDRARSLADALAGIAAAAELGAQLAVLPECTYPGYVLLRRSLPGGEAGVEHALHSIARAARRCGIDVCIGIARRGEDGQLRNEAAYVDRHGAEIARYAKVFLWNFDGKWFAPGTSIDAFDTQFGRLGMMICADGRMPEIARSLARRGAWLILDPTAWVAFGGSYESMRNPQVDYVMSVRARENGVWIAAADKCGSEYGAVHYVGSSMIVAPDGCVAASAPAQKPAIVIAEAKRGNHRPFVAALSVSERRALRRILPAAAGSRRSLPVKLGIIQGPLRKAETRKRMRAALLAQGVQSVIETDASLASIGAALHRARGLRSAVIAGSRMLAPEPTRAAALRGADLIAWARIGATAGVREIARTRALENRVYVLVCSLGRDETSACLVDPNGTVVVEALLGTADGFIAAVDPRDARDKTVVPGTDAFGARMPRAFALFDGRGAP